MWRGIVFWIALAPIVFGVVAALLLALAEGAMPLLVPESSGSAVAEAVALLAVLLSYAAGAVAVWFAWRRLRGGSPVHRNRPDSPSRVTT